MNEGMQNIVELEQLEKKLNDKNFDIACQLADDLYFKFIDSLHDDIANEYVVADEDNIGCTKNTEKGSELYWDIENTIKNTLDKKESEVK
jgi:hypothetical protein